MLLGTQRVREDGTLEIGGVSAVDLAKRFGTPLYVIDEATLRDRARAYVTAFAASYAGRSAVAYAAKACQTGALCRIAAQEGLWMDVASGGELACALHGAFPSDRLLMHGNYKSPEEIAAFHDADGALLVIDCREEIERVEELAREGRVVRPMRALLRLTPGVDAHTHDKMAVAVEDSKFGFSIASGAALEAAKRASASAWIDLVGIHCHIGSQILEVEPFAEAVERMVGFSARCRDEAGLSFEVLDLGGGLGIRHTDEDGPSPSASDLARFLSDAVTAACEARVLPLPTLIVEPGRSLIGEAGTTLYTVGVVKDLPGVRTYVAVDGGLSDNPRPALYGARYAVLCANKASAAADRVVTVSGKHCETDTLFRDVALPETAPGDILAVPAAGGYTFAMASNYNRLPRPAVVLVADGQAEVIVERQTPEDLLRGDVIPERLRG